MFLDRQLDSRFVTLFVVILQANGELTYANAGHNPSALVSNGSVQRLTEGGVPIGLLPDSNYLGHTRLLRPGDTLVIFSDGFTEAFNAAGEEYGDDRLIASLRTAASKDLPDLLKDLFVSVKAFSGSIAQCDDISAVVARYRPQSD